MHRLAVSLLLVSLLVGCDSQVEEGYDGIVEVALVGSEDALGLRLVAIGDGGCGRPLIASLEKGAAVRRIVVRGLGADNPCDAIVPASATVALDLGPELPGGYLVEIRHAGALDRYQLDLTTPAPTLHAVRTSATRLAP